MAKFCVYEKQGGLCQKTGTYCNLSCPYKEIKEFAPVVYGTWEEVDSCELTGDEILKFPKGALRCSACAHAFAKTLLWERNFCPNCGARMDGGG